MKLLSLLRSLEPGAERGALVLVRDLRNAAGASGSTVEAIDAAVLQHARWGNVSLHCTDYVATVPTDELDRDYLHLPGVETEGNGNHPSGRYVVGVAIRQK